MQSIPRQSLFNRSLTSRLSIFHNGKGRPELRTRAFSSSPASVRSPVQALRAGRPAPSRLAIAIPGTFRCLSTTPSQDPLLRPNPIPASEPASFVQQATSPNPAEPNAWDASFDGSGVSEHLTAIEPHIGYLKELGLDFGWGPTSTMQWVIEHIHVYGGLPWYGTLAATAVLIRILLIPLYLRGADASARMSAVQHIMAPMTAKMSAARRAGDQTTMMMAAGEIRALERSAGIKKSRAFLPILIQGPLAFGVFRLVRNMADVPVPGLETGGALWFTDLTLTDPYYILPALTSLSLYLGMRKGGEMGQANAQSAQAMRIMTYIFPVVSFVFTANFVTALTLQFFITSVLSLGQTYLLINPRIRAALGVYPLTKRDSSQGQAYKGTITRHVNTTVNEPKIGTFKKMMKRAESVMGPEPGSKQGPRLSKSAKAKADAYEKRRREELEEEAYHRRQKLKNRDQQDR